MNLHRIEQYKNKGELLSNTNARILLDNLALQNFKIFNYADINFHKNLTIIIGKNGTGKTSLLKAIVYGISSTIVKTNINLQNFVKLPQNGEFEDSYYEEATISLQSSKRDFAQTSATTISSYNGAIPVFSNKSLWLSSYNRSYFQDETLEQLVFCCSQNRQESDNSYTTHNIKKPRIKDLENFLNGVLYNGFNDFNGWVSNIGNKNEIDSSENHRLITKVFEIISAIIGEPVSVDVNNYAGTFIQYENFDKKMPIDLMSDGEKNIIGWVGYFMLRLWEVWQDWHKERQMEQQHEFWEHPALVLIDEIDTYLHPQWQSTIMAVLVEKFPNVQFVITTHSPYVVGSVPSDKIKIYTCDKNEEGEVDVMEFKGFTPYGADVKELSARLYGNIERPVKAIQEMFVDLFADLEQFENEPNDADLEQKINATIIDLESKIHAADPELISAKSQLAMIQTLNEMEKEGVK